MWWSSSTAKSALAQLSTLAGRRASRATRRVRAIEPPARSAAPAGRPRSRVGSSRGTRTGSARSWHAPVRATRGSTGRWSGRSARRTRGQSGSRMRPPRGTSVRIGQLAPVHELGQDVGRIAVRILADEPEAGTECDVRCGAGMLSRPSVEKGRQYGCRARLLLDGWRKEFGPEETAPPARSSLRRRLAHVGDSSDIGCGVAAAIRWRR